MDLLSRASALCQSTFGFSTFRPLQKEVLQMVFEKRDSLLILPTGGGKSLCYQLPSLVLGGVTIVVSPLISLMKDQVDQLVQLGISATFINSSVSSGELYRRIECLRNLEYRLVYVAPERLETDVFLEVYRSLVQMGKVDLIAVDEAHCVSQWGHDFRPSYRKIIRLREAGAGIPILALTATATEKVKKDIVSFLKLSNGKIFRGQFDRANLMYRVHQARSKKAFLEEYLRGQRESSGIIYCATRKNVERVHDFLKDEGVSIGKYHAGISDEDRKEVQEKFIKDKLKVIVATNAFGMGIDKPDVRFVIHFDMPGSVENYVQEAGRAGRDGERSECVLLYDYSDIMTQRFFIDGNNPPVELISKIVTLLVGESLTGIALRELLPKGSNGMAVDSTLRMLEGWGALSRPDNGRYEMIAQDFKIPFEEIDQKRRMAEMKLRCMVGFSESQLCKRNFIQKYFGFEEVKCELCSSCLNPSQAAEKIDVSDIGRVVIGAVASFPRFFGLGMVTSILTGSRSANILKWKCESWKAYNALSGHTKDEVMELLRELIKSGYLDRTNDEYPVVMVSQKGRVAFESGEAIVIMKQQESVTAGDDDMGQVDRELFESLRSWRREKAEQLDIPPYMILSDRTLKGISASFPQTDSELLQVQGMGRYRLEQYGDDLLKILRDYCREKGLAFRPTSNRQIRRRQRENPVSKGESPMRTLELLESGKNPLEVAKERGLAISTIEGHMADLVLWGKISDVSRYINPERKQRILKAIAEVGDGGLSPIKNLVGEDVSYGEIRLVMAERRVKG